MKGRLAIGVAMLLAACGRQAETAGPAAPQVDPPVVAQFAASESGAYVAPSFNCARAESEAEKLVCANSTLARLDIETARLFELARTGPEAARHPLLAAGQRGFIKGRDDCWKSDDKPACVRDSYVIRIAELRAAYPDARRDDVNGISIGPLAVDCPGFGSLQYSVLKLDPPTAYVKDGGDLSLVLVAGPAGSGVRYARTVDGGEYVFWEARGEALFMRPGQKAVQCTISKG